MGDCPSIIAVGSWLCMLFIRLGVLVFSWIFGWNSVALCYENSVRKLVTLLVVMGSLWSDADFGLELEAKIRFVANFW